MATKPNERYDDHGWHLDKKVPLGLILAAIVQAVALLGGYYKIVTDVEVLKADVGSLHSRDTKIEFDLRESVALIRDQYVRVEAKLDRLIERTHK